MALPLFFFAEKAARQLPVDDVGHSWQHLRVAAVGAGFGSTIGTLIGSSIALSAILGMTGYFAGVVQAPMTAFVIIFEMTGDHGGDDPDHGGVDDRLRDVTFPVARTAHHSLSRVFIAAVIRRGARRRRLHTRKSRPMETSGVP